MALLANAVAGAKRILNKMATTLSTPISQFRTPADLNPIIEFTREEKARQAEVLKARAYHDGAQGIKIPDDLREFIGLNAEEAKEFSMNFSEAVVMASVERLQFKGVKPHEEDESSEADQKTFKKWMRKLVRSSRLGAKASDIIESAIRDGEYFVIVDYDNVDKIPRLHLHQRYTDPEIKFGDAQGDGEGVKFFYPNNDTNQKPIYAVKRWSEGDVKWMTVYEPHQNITWKLTSTGWVADGNPVVWTNPNTGDPLGIPVVVFYTPDRKPGAKRVWGLQRATNMLVVELLQAVHIAVFRVWIYFGWAPKDKDGNPLKINAKTWIGNETKKPADASATAVEGSDPTPVGDILDNMITKMATLSSTPLSRLLPTRQVASEGTLKQQNDPLFAKCRRYRENLSVSFEDVFNIARRLELAFGEVELNPDLEMDCDWEPFEARTAEEELKELEVEAKKVAVQIAKGQRGVSMRQSQKELGYSDKEISTMADEVAEERSSSNEGFSKLFNNGQ